jgi:hypothetical protein
VPDGRGGWLTLEQRIQQLKTDPRFCGSLPNPVRIAKSDVDGVRGNFEAIASGAAVVE